MLEDEFKTGLIDSGQEMLERIKLADEMSLDEGVRQPFYVLVGGMAFDDGLIQTIIVPNDMPPQAVKAILETVLGSDMLTEDQRIDD